MTRIVASLFFGLFVLATAPSARATLLIDPGQCGANAAACLATNGVVTAIAFEPVELFPVITDPGYLRFQQAFNSWNTGGWTLALGTLSAEASMTVTLYRAYVNEGCGIFCGGAEIEVTYNNGGNAPNPIAGCAASPCASVNDGDAVWSQSILTDRKLAGSQPGKPYIDNAPAIVGASIGPPAHPFQYNGSELYDKPARDADARWLADAWISTIDSTDQILTLYGGLSWGFIVPEPASVALLLVGIAGAALARRRADRRRP